MSHVQDAILDLQREALSGHSSVDTAMAALEHAANDLAFKIGDVKNTYENLMDIGRAGAQVRQSIARAVDAIYDAVKEIHAID